MIDVVVGDDHAVFVDALSTVLGQRRLVVRAVAHRAADVLTAVTGHSPTICLLDRTFADGDGIELIPDLLAASPRTRVVVVTADPDRGVAARALARGATGFVHKTRGVTALVDTIHRVVDGETVVELPPRRPDPGPSGPSGHSGAPVPADPSSSDGVDPAAAVRLASYLTRRERQCLALMVDGRSTTEIASAWGVSVTTVRTHVQAVLTKLGVHTRLEAATLAARHDLVAASPA